MNDPQKPPRSAARGCIVALATLALLLAGFFACVIDSSPIDPEDVPEIEQRAAPVIIAIDAYTTANRRPPENLEQLVPNYLDSIPLPLQGQPDRFQYYRYERDVAGQAEHTWMLEVWGWRGGFFSNEAIVLRSTDRQWRYVPHY